MQGVQDCGNYMHVLDHTKEEVLAEPKGVLGGPPNTTTLTTVENGRGGKHVHETQADALDLHSAVTTPKKAKLLESMGA